MIEEGTERIADGAGFREFLTDAVRYWERRRWIYNGGLMAVVLLEVLLWWPIWPRLTVQTALVVFICAVLANMAYCAAYPVDVLLQYSSLRAAWRTRRGYLLTVGTLFACAITYLVAVGAFMPVD
jgi:hypothetical protein